MAFNYNSPDRDQLLLLPPAVKDWLPESHLVWFVLDAVALVDTTRFHDRHPNDGVGRAAYHPDMMLALLIYAYCCGMRSSRRIEAACRTDLAFRAITVQLVPAYVAIARFRVDHENAIKAVFFDVLRLCHRAGLASLGTVAIDGTKIGSDAALDRNRTGVAIRALIDTIMSEAATADTRDAGQRSLDGSLPPDLARPGTRRARLEAALAEIETQQDALDESRAEAESMAAHGRMQRGPKPSEPHAAARRAELDVAALSVKAAAATSILYRLGAEAKLATAKKKAETARRTAETAPGPPELKANITDPESRIMKTVAGWIQGFNAQVGVNDNQVIIAPDVTQDCNDVNQYKNMTDAVMRAATNAGISENVATFLADGGYWSEANATTPGPQRLIATTKDCKQRRAARLLGTTQGPRPPTPAHSTRMEHRLRTAEGAASYAR